MHKLSTFVFAPQPSSVMRRPARLRMLVGLAILALTGLIGAAVPAAAGPPIDPNTLQPVPPNATCRDDGPQIICDTFLEETAVNEPVADLPCGTIYETSYYRGDGTRWYVDRLAVKRHVAASLDGTWSLSPTGAGPTVKISGHWSIWSVWTTPGDDSTLVEYRSSGSDFKLSAAGFGVILHDAGVTYADGTHHGVSAQIPFTPEVTATLCSALTS